MDANVKEGGRVKSGRCGRRHTKQIIHVFSMAHFFRVRAFTYFETCFEIHTVIACKNVEGISLTPRTHTKTSKP